jgi:hypothetical protein
MPSPAATALDTTDEHSTTALYRAAIGPVNPDYYLPLFTRFEAAGRGGLSWNWSAALYTLNWLAFRRLWHAALVYGGSVVLLVLGVLGIGRLVYQFSDSTQWTLMGGLMALAVLLPGFGGNAVLFVATRQRLEAALKATTSVAEACILLERQAPSRKGLISQMVGNALAVGLAGFSWGQFTGMAPLPSALPKIESAGTDARNVAVGRTTDASSVPTAPTASAPREAASAPAAVASAPQVMASSPAPAASDAWTPPTVTLPPLTRPAASEPVTTPATTTPATTIPAKVPAKQPAPAQAAERPTTPAAPATATPPTRRSNTRPVNRSVAVEALPSTVPQGNTPRALQFSVNVGSFTDENQALNAYVALTDARLPATRQTFVDRNGPRVEVRVGPYDTATEAEAAAETVRALGLGAQQPTPR